MPDGKDPNYEVGDPYSKQEAIRPLVVTNCSEYVVAHSTYSLRPARFFSEVLMLPHILETMRKLGLNRLLRLQAYSWPHLGAGLGHGALIVGAPRSGRTFAYVPPVCQAVCKVLAESRRQRMLHPGKWPENELGAVALILVPDLARVRQVSAMCQALLRKARSEDGVTLTLSVPTAVSSEFLLRLLNGVGCLVATPAQLACFWREAPGLLRFPRLQFLVYDDVDLMSAEQLRNAKLVVQEILPTSHYPQVVMEARSYSEALMTKMRMASNHPAVIFGDVLEAALYGGTRIRIFLARLQAKSDKVVQVLKQRSPQAYRTVVYCMDDAEMQELVQALEDRGFGCLPYFQTSDLEVLEQFHHWLANTRGVILLCTDNCPELIIRNAHTLIHYGMGNSFSKFKMRHLTLSGNLTNSLAPTVSQVSLLSLVLLDNSNQRQLPRLVDFLRSHQQLDPAVVAVAQRIRRDIESKKSNEQALCGQIFVFGECRDPVCEDRHHVADLDRRPSYVPASGDVKVQLVRVYSPTHFCVRLLEHLPPKGNSKAMPFLAIQEIRLKLLQDKQPHRYWPPVAGAICMLHTAHIKERVRVLKVAPIQDVNLLSSDIAVKVQALDVDTRVVEAQSGRLFECSKALLQEPPMSCDLRLLGVVPQSGESSWAEEERTTVECWLKNLPKGHFLQAKIQFAAANTLFVQDLVAMVYADNSSRIIWEADESTLKKMEKEIEEPESPQVLHARCPRLIQKAREVTQKNQLMQKDQEFKSKATPKSNSNIQSSSQSNEDSMSQLYKCIRNCAMFQLEDAKQVKNDPNQVTIDPVEFLNQVMGGGSNQCDPPQVNPKPKKKTNKARTALPPVPAKTFKEEIPLQTHPNVSRPYVTYYQNTATLELQVCLPEDDQQYGALFLGSQIFFTATSKLSDLVHQFFLNLKFPYSSVCHHMVGRTAYISVVKSLAFVDPLDFAEYRFMKPNLEMFYKIEDSKSNSFKRLLAYRGYVQEKVHDEHSSEDSDEEERDLDGTERVDHGKLFDLF
ncbi:putative ATP-dependent RNA helicase BoYb [Drosophila biarmipes]|uniref:putative ATP-dependent RNA helicase BoYb n=1 Tax=Drosophila biarmipes TaxID=125945 RepID=UPI0021CCACD0|nr:putative ATP-dependent RNA helicase BoYb [Drosophila biarmipes]